VSAKNIPRPNTSSLHRHVSGARARQGLLAPQTISLSRDFSFERALSAKEHEADILRQTNGARSVSIRCAADELEVAAGVNSTVLLINAIDRPRLQVVRIAMAGIAARRAAKFIPGLLGASARRAEWAQNLWATRHDGPFGA